MANLSQIILCCTLPDAPNVLVSFILLFLFTFYFKFEFRSSKHAATNRLLLQHTNQSFSSRLRRPSNIKRLPKGYMSLHRNHRNSRDNLREHLGFHLSNSRKMPRAPKSFRVLARNYFITYPQCPLDKQFVLSFLLNIPYTICTPKYIRVAQELHRDGDQHLHCLLQFPGQYECTNNRFFDIQCPSSTTTYHPNIQEAKNSSAVREYISKHDNYADHGSFIPGGRSNGGDDCYREALKQNTPEDAMAIIKEGDPRTFILQLHKINSNLNKIFEKPPQPFSSPLVNFTVPVALQEWCRDNIRDATHRPDRPISCIIEGASRMGITSWARSLGPHNYLSGPTDFIPKTYSNDAYYNILDDVAPSHLKSNHWKELIGSNHDWQADCKRSKPILIKGGIPTIVLCNPGESSSYKAFLERPDNQGLREWTIKNAEFFFLEDDAISTPT